MLDIIEIAIIAALLPTIFYLQFAKRFSWVGEG
jgi:hypothetical protein